MVLTPEEVRDVLGQLRGTTRVICIVLYGSGMWLMECLTLRIKDLDPVRGEILIRRGKGAKDRVTVLPTILRPVLDQPLCAVRDLHARDCSAGAASGWVMLPGGLDRKYPQAGRSLQCGCFRRVGGM